MILYIVEYIIAIIIAVIIAIIIDKANDRKFIEEEKNNLDEGKIVLTKEEYRSILKERQKYLLAYYKLSDMLIEERNKKN